MKNNINLAMCFDKNLWMQVGVALTSLFYSSKSKCHYNIYCLVSNDVDDVCINELSNLVKNYDNYSRIKFIYVDDLSLFKGKKFSVATYYRLFLHELLPDVDKIIYTDVDVIFKKDLFDLYNINMGNNLLAGVRDSLTFLKNSKSKWRYKNKLSMSLDTYVNAGVLLMNLKEIRKSCMENVWKDMIPKTYMYHDQDILNISCFGKIMNIDFKYNCQLACLMRNVHNKDLNKIFKESILNPVIIHYTGYKPWNSVVKFGDIWNFYAMKSPFGDVLFHKFIMDKMFPGKTEYRLFFIPFMKKICYGNKVKYTILGIPFIRNIYSNK